MSTKRGEISHFFSLAFPSLFDVPEVRLKHIKLVQSWEKKGFSQENEEFSLFSFPPISNFNEVLKIKIEQTINFHESPWDYAVRGRANLDNSNNKLIVVQRWSLPINLQHLLTSAERRTNELGRGKSSSVEKKQIEWWKLLGSYNSGESEKFTAMSPSWWRAAAAQWKEKQFRFFPAMCIYRCALPLNKE